MRTAALLFVAFGLGTAFMISRARAQTTARDHWVGAWASAQQGPEEILGIRAEPLGSVDPDGGPHHDCRNWRKSSPSQCTLRVASAHRSVHFALAREGCSALPASDRILTFGGKSSITIPPGAPALSDPITLTIPALTEVAISLFIPQESTADTFHFLAQRPTCISKSGDLTGQEQWPGAEQKQSCNR